MIEAIIAHECESLSAALRRAAGAATSAATMRQIAQAMEYVTQGAAMYYAGMGTPLCRTPDGLIIAAHVYNDNHMGRATVVTGTRRTQTRWSCSCAASIRAWNGVCAHMVAVKLAIAVDAATARQRERAECRKQIPRLAMDMGVKKTQLERAQAAQREAQRNYDKTRTAYEELIDQLNADDAQGRAELTSSERSTPHVALMREAA